MKLYFNSGSSLFSCISVIGLIQFVFGQTSPDKWQQYQQDSLLQIQCNNRVLSGSVYPQIQAKASENGYTLSIIGDKLREVVWFHSQGQLIEAVESKELIPITDPLDFHYAVMLDSLGCVYTTDPIRPGIQNSTLSCEDTCNTSTILFTETFTQAEHCSSSYNFPQSSDHTFSGLSVNGPSCAVHPMIQQLNPLLPEGLFYLENNAVSINPFWNRTDASMPSDAFLIGDPWDYPELKIWYHDFSLIAGETYCFSVKVSNVQNNQSSGYLPVVDLRFSDVSGFQWPASFQLFGQPLTLRHSDGWMTLSGSFQASATGIHRIAIVNNATVSTNTNGIGRNLAIDDISFKKVDVALPTLSSSQSIICTGDTVTLYATSNLPNYTCSWSTIPASTITQACSFTDAPVVSTLYYMGTSDQGCNSSIFITVKPTPTVDLKVLSEICYGDSAHIDFQFSGNAPWVFQYTDGSTISTITALSSPYNLSFLPSGNTAITVFNLTSDGCIQTIPSTVTVNPRPLPFALLTGNSPLTIGQSATLSVILSGTPPWDFIWTDGTTQFPVSGVTQSPYQLSVTPTTNLIYSLVSVTDFCSGNVNGSIVAGEPESVSNQKLRMEDKFSIAPNPVFGNMINIQTPYPNPKPDKIFIYDVRGRMIPFEVIQTSNDHMTLQLPAESNGVYFLHLHSGKAIQQIKCILTHNNSR